MYGTGQYGLQYSPSNPGSPGLPMRQPGTWMPNFPPGIVGTMQSGSPAELSYMQDPSLIPQLSQLYGVQVPTLTSNPEKPMLTGRFAARGAALRSGRYPMDPPPDRLPPPMCGPNEQRVYLGQGTYRCVPPYEGPCPPGYKEGAFATDLQEWICVPGGAVAPTTSVMTPPKTLPPPPPPPGAQKLSSIPGTSSPSAQRTFCQACEACGGYCYADPFSGDVWCMGHKDDITLQCMVQAEQRGESKDQLPPPTTPQAPSPRPATAVASRRPNTQWHPPIPPGCVGGSVFKTSPNAPVPKPKCPTGTVFRKFYPRSDNRVEAICCAPSATAVPGAGPRKPRRRGGLSKPVLRRRNVIGTMALGAIIARAVRGAVR
jgi:hypothetical protein